MTSDGKSLSPKRAQSKVSNSLPAITSDQERKKLREELEDEYIK